MPIGPRSKKKALPCGQDGALIYPQNTMSSLEVLELFLTAVRDDDIATLEALVVSPETFPWGKLSQIPTIKRPLVTPSQTSPCVDEFVVGFSQSNIWLAVLQRQYRARMSTTLGRYKMPRNSLFWRIIEFQRIRV